MHWLEESSEQFVPQTPTIFHSFSQGSSQNSPNVTVPENSDYSSSQESQGTKSLNKLFSDTVLTCLCICKLDSTFSGLCITS
jgi:hypothetical protein